MSATGLEVFDTTVQKTNSWLKEMMEVLEWDDRQKTYRSMRAVLHALRDRLTVEEAADFASQLPMLMRGFFYEGWKPAGKPLRERHKDQFLARVAQELKEDGDNNPALITSAVFSVIQTHVTDGEIEDVKRVLPRELQELWPA